MPTPTRTIRLHHVGRPTTRAPTPTTTRSRRVRGLARLRPPTTPLRGLPRCAPTTMTLLGRLRVPGRVALPRLARHPTPTTTLGGSGRSGTTPTRPLRFHAHCAPTTPTS